MNESSTETAATELGNFISTLSSSEIPDSGLRVAERAILDTVGVTLAGARTDAAEAALAAIGTTDGSTTVIGRDESLGLPEAVFVNGTAGHALDFDDVALAATDGHPSVPMIAPIFAVGEREGSNGRELLTAFVAGFEAQSYLSRPISPGHYEGGWHATSTVGVFGATAAVASLLDLSESETAHALSIAASMPAGLKRNFGSTTKPIHAGQAARSGTTAALLAAEGATANRTAIEGERGFFDLYRGDGTPDPDRRYELGDRWAIVDDGIDVKKYPCCYYTHAAIYAAIGLREQYDLTAGAVDSVAVTASRGAVDALQHENPTTGLEAKFSMQYLIARALADGEVGLSAFDDHNIDGRAIQSLRERVKLVVDDDLPYDSNAARVAVETRDGETYERFRERPPGTHDDPLSAAELHEKFRMCAARAPDSVATESIIEVLDDLRSVSDIESVLDVL